MSETTGDPAASLEKKAEDLSLATDNNDDGDTVDPWNVTSKSETGIDYDKLISKIYLPIGPRRLPVMVISILTIFREVWQLQDRPGPPGPDGEDLRGSREDEEAP